MIFMRAVLGVKAASASHISASWCPLGHRMGLARVALRAGDGPGQQGLEGIGAKAKPSEGHCYTCQV